jgi:hypothetical protein
MTNPGRVWKCVGPGVLVALLLSLCSFVPLPRQTVAAQESFSAAQQLAEKYAPIAYLRVQKAACDKDGEGYYPAPVEIVLGNPEVALKHNEGADSSENDPIIMMGPTAQDLVGLDDNYYLDFPGNPRRARCTYETDFKRFAAAIGAEPTAYARIVVDEAEERLVLQYWMYFYFNDWNNTHETDWEMFQLVFDATTPEEALALAPSAVGYAQHGGGELSEWGDGKMTIEDGRPAVFPAAGSHGTYFGREQYIGWGENGTGFGCDNTTNPSIRTPLNVILIPDNPSFDSEFAWVYFDGRWGERKTWEFNGPFGPNMGRKWDDPLGAMADWRDSSLSIPSSNSIGPSATDTFCYLSETGSKVLIELGTRPWLLLTLVVALLGLIGFLFVAARRDLGAAFAVYRKHLRTFLGIGVLTIPIGIAYNGLAILARENPPMDWVVNWFNDTSGARLFAASTVGILQQASMLIVIAPPVLQAITEIRSGREPVIIDCFRKSYRRIWPLIVALLIILVVVSFLTIIVIGIPLAIFFTVRWQFFGQAAILDNASSGWDAIRRSAHSVHGDWWRTFKQTIVFQLFAFLPGPFLGAVLMLLGKTTVDFANTFSSVVYAVTVPISIIGLTLAYERFKGEHGMSPSAPSPSGD